MAEAKTKKYPARKPSAKAASKPKKDLTQPSPKLGEGKRRREDKSGSFAVFATGGKQYKVSVGSKVKIEKIPGNYKEGDNVIFKKVLLVDDGKETQIGSPFISGAEVATTLRKIGR